MSPTSPTLYAVTIDTEEQWDWDAGWPVRAHSLDNIQVLPEFEALCAAHRARTTWFTNWSVLASAASRRTVLELAARPGVEIGMHIHPWLTPPRAGGDEEVARFSYLHNHSERSIRAKLASVYDLFAQIGLLPRSFRGGRYSSGGAIHEFLKEKGFTVDCSIVPFSSWPDEGAPDYRHEDGAPRRVGLNRDGRGFWELPLTLGFTRPDFRWWADWYHRFESPPLSYLRPIAFLERLNIVRRVWLNFEAESPDAMVALLSVIRRLEMPFVIFTIHSSSLVPGGNPYSSKNQVPRIWTSVDRILREVNTRGDFEPATVGEIGDALEAKHRQAL